MLATTTAGKIEGLELEGCLQFRGVPYAAPPTGALRFREPQPVEPWDGVRPALEHGPVAPQPPSPLESMLGSAPPVWDEDCLTLTITTPSLDGERPVMVWIHGGAFTAGTGSTPWYDGRNLARRGDVVVVSINYRLGAFGFLHLEPTLGDEFRNSGALGIFDQQAALRWVQDNIAGFGGDPSRVTIFGESAGGMSVGTLVASPLSRGLFSGAIAQSGACHNIHAPDRAAELASLLLRHAGLSDSAADGVLDLPASTLVEAQHAMSTELLASSSFGDAARSGLPFQPVRGFDLLPDAPLDAVRRGVASGVRLMAGSTSEEWRLFALMAGSRSLDDDALTTRLGQIFGPERAGNVLDVYRSNRPDQPADAVWSAIVTDYVFRVPAVRLLEAQHATGAPTFAYEFAHRSTAFGGALGACHAIEIPFVFDNLDRRGVDMFVGRPGDAERALASQTSAAWLAFARGDEPWEPYDTERRATMRLGGDAPGLVADPAADERTLWDGVL